MTRCERCGATIDVRQVAGQMVAAPCSNCGRESRPLTPWQHGILEHVVGQLERAPLAHAGQVHVNIASQLPIGHPQHNPVHIAAMQRMQHRG